MKKTISALWHGTLSDTDCFVYPDFVMEDLKADLENLEATLTATLEKEQLEHFKTYARYTDDWVDFNKELAFINGFRVAARLFAEVYAD